MTDATGPSGTMAETAEGKRLAAIRHGEAWRAWGPYLSERQWGSVREDYSADGDAWDYVTHDLARSKAYRWGEDGIGGFSDDDLRWCLSVALWNGRDPILKERLFGLTNAQGNHGEDVKELYYYLDGTPTHSYMRMLYKYPHAEYPYAALLAENARRGPLDPEFEIIDTGVFAEGRYFDVTIEYAKAAPDDIFMRITVENHADAAAVIHVLPHVWARNVWSWSPGGERPRLAAAPDGSVTATRADMAARRLEIDGPARWLFCENDTNPNRLFGIKKPGIFKCGINDFVVHGNAAAISETGEGTKCAAHVVVEVPAKGASVIKLRFRPETAAPGFAAFDTVFAARIAEADEFHAGLQKGVADEDSRRVQRQALAGMLWSKQFYYIDIPVWLDGDPGQPPPPASRKRGRNADWRHLNNADIISMPDKWEYPWYAAWDLAFHCVVFSLIDPGFAKQQLVLLTREWYMHPNGQLPAYEWEFGDVNPPVHAWAAWRVYQMDKAAHGAGDRAFLERIFHKLMLNFTWWVNRKDADGRNIFQGGFLGLDNIGIFDRSKPLPTGGYINQSDGTAWMAMYALNLMRISIELAGENPVYEDTATKFFEHFLAIAEAMTDREGDGTGLWDEQDGFYYDALHLPDSTKVPLRVRSMVGLIPLFAVEVLDSDTFATRPHFAARLRWFLKNRPELASLVSRWEESGKQERNLLSLLRGHRMKLLLRRMLDETEFLSEYGIRAVSKFHEANPYTFEHGGQQYGVGYVPGEGINRLFGGNSNWRGPIWMPVNYMVVEALYEFHRYYGDDFTVECPVGSGQKLSLRQVADELSRRLTRMFLRGPDGRRPMLGDNETMQRDPAFRDHLLFHEYFHGDTGRGLGASHQTGWTGLVALLLQPRSETSAITLPTPR